MATVVDIADGLFGKEPLSKRRERKAELELEQYRHLLTPDMERKEEAAE